jgi:hypothetical protein
VISAEDVARAEAASAALCSLDGSRREASPAFWTERWLEAWFSPAGGSAKSMVYVFTLPSELARAVSCSGARSGPDSISGIKMIAAAIKTAAPTNRSCTRRSTGAKYKSESQCESPQSDTTRLQPLQSRANGHKRAEHDHPALNTRKCQCTLATRNNVRAARRDLHPSRT